MIKRVWILLMVFLLGITELSACGISKRASLKKVTKNYLLELETIIGDDSFSVAKTPRMDLKTTHLPFTVKSKKYGKTFTVFMSRDGQEVMDNYYIIDLEEDIQKWAEDLTELFEYFIPGIQMSASLRSYALPEFSAQKFESLTALKAVAGELPLLCVKITSGSQKIEKSEIDQILAFLMTEGIFCTLTIEEDVLWYDINEEGILETRKTGKDGNYVLERKEYEIKPHE